MKRNILKVMQSWMYASRWLLTLDCGHEVWTTFAKRPKAKAVACPRCAPQEMPVVSASDALERGERGRNHEEAT